MSVIALAFENERYRFGFFIILILGMVESIALIKGVDGVALTGAVGAICAVAGWAYGRKVR